MVIDEAALLKLLRLLKSRHYQFTCVSPATHRRVIARPLARPPTLRDIFGWNRPFSEGDLDPDLLHLLERAECLDERANRLRSRVRVASLGNHLFLHSPYPTDSQDAVFFGPDSYRFANFIAAHLPQVAAAKTIVDMGAGSGVGGIIAARLAPTAAIILADVNPAALQFAAINAKAAGAMIELMETATVPGPCDVLIANPPYMIDTKHRAYRDGGNLWGAEVACRWVDQALRSLVPGGTMLLYTGAAMVGERSPLLERLTTACTRLGAELSSIEIDPDVFGDELEYEAYNEVDRIAVLGLLIKKSASASPQHADVNFPPRHRTRSMQSR